MRINKVEKCVNFVRSTLFPYNKAIQRAHNS